MASFQLEGRQVDIAWRQFAIHSRQISRGLLRDLTKPRKRGKGECMPVQCETTGRVWRVMDKRALTESQLGKPSRGVPVAKSQELGQYHREELESSN
jgi:hypothetical protein